MLTECGVMNSIETQLAARDIVAHGTGRAIARSEACSNYRLCALEDSESVVHPTGSDGTDSVSLLWQRLPASMGPSVLPPRCKVVVPRELTGTMSSSSWARIRINQLNQGEEGSTLYEQKNLDHATTKRVLLVRLIDHNGQN